MRGVLLGLGLDREAMRRAACHEELMAAGLAVALSREGMPFRKAHALVGSLVAEARRAGAPLRETAARVLPAHSPAVAGRLESLFDPRRAVGEGSPRRDGTQRRPRLPGRGPRARLRSRRADSLARVARDVVACERCPRLRSWCREVARVKVKRFRDQEYWGKPIPGLGDRSGDFLFAALHRAGFANQPTSVARDDGLRLADCYIAPIVRCAPPANKPAPEEIRNCRTYLAREWALLRDVRAVLVLGKLAMDGFLALLRETGRVPRRKGFALGHGVSHDLGQGLRLYCSYHPSQQNTFTSELTPARFDAVLAAIGRHLGRPAPGSRA